MRDHEYALIESSFRCGIFADNSEIADDIVTFSSVFSWLLLALLSWTNPSLSADSDAIIYVCMYIHTFYTLQPQQ